ncbi:hypothetical protein D0C16_12865 [Cellvibrio sp. KY-GH-1]|uniref:diiron oxygenase n=1 Tax=Cellvibrio sp. KY-GH-1 TaxID=2303332 RepID=UPI0012450D5B|nr:diiron oxygenase [Cellvibrio sp. KY-GH-1]QEY16783.1 hypothetical protein D0C16_12865 [Cellvibrio sp. KY-GH-1]
MNSAKLANKLADRSKDNFYNVYEIFEWPETLPNDNFWLGGDLLTIHNTEISNEASEHQKIHLSQLETINLFSIFAHGESDLLQTILKNCFRPDLAHMKEYLIHFIDEENKHMWFFSEFCRRYDGGVFPSRKFEMPSKFSPDLERLLAFLRILIFEEIGDFFNANTIKNHSIPTFVRAIHERHHLDEVGHIAIGWKIAEELLVNLKTVDTCTLKNMIRHIDNYIQISLQGFYNPDVYQRVGFAEPYELREKLICHPGRVQIHNIITKRARSKLNNLWTLVDNSEENNYVA